jgi:hypothetical protein
MKPVKNFVDENKEVVDTRREGSLITIKNISRRTVSQEMLAEERKL